MHEAYSIELLLYCLMDVMVVSPGEKVGTRADMYGWGASVSPS